MSDGSPIQIYRPDGDVQSTSFALAPSLTTLAGCRIAVLDNGKPNAAYVMTRAAQYLADRAGATLALVVKKGPGGRSANAAIPCAPDVFTLVVEAADIVITGAADCGSCSAYSVSDSIQLERAGVPTVIVTTTHFEPVVDTLAANGGMPGIRKLVLDHPIGGTDHRTLEARAGDATDRLVELFTGSGPTGATSSVPGAPATIDIGPLRALVAADGADLEVDEVDRLAGTVRLRLILPDASCSTCLMPSDVLATIAFERLAPSLPGLRSVVVLDPRDEPVDHAGRP
jgi:Fe-S cluster biogenesis protein NfuA